MRQTRQRKLILEHLKRLPNHPTATEIYDRVRQDLPSISLGTVYRNLDYLCSLGLARRLETFGGQKRFDAIIADHMHAICTECGKVRDIEESPEFNLSNIFEETANQEKEHAKRLFKFLEGGTAEVQAAFPAGKIGTTLENLNEAADGERYEHAEMYPGFARVAEEEGFPEVAEAMRSIAVAEQLHERRYRSFIANIENGRVFKKKQDVTWRCQNCGYTHRGTEAPEECPSCVHPRDHFEVLCENWQ